MEASEVDAATRFQLDAASRFQLETTGCMNPSVNLGRDMRTNYLQFVHNAGLGREMRSNDYQNMFNAASMIHENPTTNNLQFIGIKVPPTLHIPPPTLAIPNFEVPTNGTHGYSYPYSGYGKRVKSNHASSYHITRPGSGGHATYGGSTIHLSFLDRASLDHMSYESGALTAYTSGAHQVGCSGEPNLRVEEGNKGLFYSQNPMIESSGDLSSQNPMIGSSGDLSSQNPMIGSSGDLNPMIQLFENGSVEAEFVEGGSFGFPRNDSLDDICSRMLYDQDEDFKIM
ncbi:hypothetical protein AMTR_s00046p00183500 [Amborella trichopoda]|uniref:Uncharacterized protein n=1 Tax=Amborella trichopoda TaxID=13333 RepID=U5D743_AMBTC|nr:hypothetical protein AMTR_s00046p00183500 [Amborella trichopoda]